MNEVIPIVLQCAFIALAGTSLSMKNMILLILEVLVHYVVNY